MVRSADSPEVLIVGAGLSGLACARELARARVTFQIIEASDGVGGRVRTDVVDSFRLDRGFQMLPTAYPEARRVLKLEDLNLKPFFNGAEIFWGGSFHRLADPLRHPFRALLGINSPIGTLHDKYFILLLRQELKKLRHVPRETDEIPTEELLRIFGFSWDMINRFFRPFLGGIFLERELRTSSRVFQFIFAMLTQGDMTLPHLGMQAIPDQLAAALPADSMRLGCPVRAVRAGEITLESGERLTAPHVVLAVDELAATRLLNGPLATARPPVQRAVTCLYFSTPDPRLPKSPVLYLDGDGRGPVNNAAILSNVSPGYAPDGQRLISATVLGAPSSDALESAVRDQLSRWFGPGARDWRHLRSYTIAHAEPESRQLHTGANGQSPVLAPGLYQCGDYVQDVSMNGALLSGRLAAEAILSVIQQAVSIGPSSLFTAMPTRASTSFERIALQAG